MRLRPILFLLCITTLAIQLCLVVAHGAHEYANYENVYANDTCITMPQDPTCADYMLPDETTNALIGGLCGSMGTMPGCTINKYCQKDKYKNSQYCTPFVTYKELCTDMLGMSNCSTYKYMCTANNTQVKECNTNVIPLPNSKTVQAQIGNICQQMPMDGCSECGFASDTVLMASSSMAMCEYLQVYSDLCLAMPDMAECSQWKTMCKAIPDWPLCTTKGSNKPVPVMRMYFHSGLADYILFKEWVPTSTGFYVGSWFAVFIFAVLFECFKLYRTRLEAQWKREADNEDTEVLLGHVTNHGSSSENHSVKFQFKRDVMRATVHFIEVAWGLLIMLVAMTYNIGLFFAVCGGAFFGMLFVGRFIHYVPKASCH